MLSHSSAVDSVKLQVKQATVTSTHPSVALWPLEGVREVAVPDLWRHPVALQYNCNALWDAPSVIESEFRIVAKLVLLL